jgi:hypothetical protein
MISSRSNCCVCTSGSLLRGTAAMILLCIFQITNGHPLLNEVCITFSARTHVCCRLVMRLARTKGFVLVCALVFATRCTLLWYSLTCELNIRQVTRCSREKSRKSRDVLEKFLFPFIEQSKSNMSNACMLHQHKDMYAPPLSFGLSDPFSSYIRQA